MQPAFLEVLMMHAFQAAALRRRGLLLILLLVSSFCGCAKGPPPNAPVDASKARETLRAALDSWKKGSKIDSMQQGSPAIVVQDMDWEGGCRLLDYKLQNDGEEMDANLFCPVTLRLRDPQGNEVERQVTYIVGTSPVLTVFRKVF